MDFLYGPDAEEPQPPAGRRSLLGKLAVVGATGAVITGAVLGFSGLASAQATDQADTPAEAAEIAEITEDGDEGYDVESDFDGLSEDDQALILEFEQCLVDAGLDEESDVVPEEIDEIFETCEVILDDLSFEADEWLEPGDFEDFELSPEDEAILDEFEACLSEGGFEEFDEGDYDTDEGDYDTDEASEEEAELSEEELAEIDALFEGCEELLDGLSDDSFIVLEGCPDDEYEGEHVEEDLDDNTDA